MNAHFPSMLGFQKGRSQRSSYFRTSSDGCIGLPVHSPCDAQGSDEIPFRKHTIDLGPSETVAIVDMNRDGKLDIVSGENWFEQAPPAAPGEGPRWIKHKFRSLPYRDFYLEDLATW